MEFPPPGSPAPGAPPPLRAQGGQRPPAAVAAPAAAVTPVAPATGPTGQRADPSAFALAGALLGAAVGLWMERRWGR